MMLPSGSLNHAALFPGVDRMPLTVFKPGHVVLLEHHALLLQSLDLGLEVLDLPEGLAGLGGSGAGRGVEEHPRAFPALVDDAARDHLAGLEAHLLLVETARAGHVGNRDIRHDRSVLQHPAMILAGTASRLSTADGRAAIGVIVRPGSISQAIAAAQRGSLDGRSSLMARMILVLAPWATGATGVLTRAIGT